jgi:hypothetical protein
MTKNQPKVKKPVAIFACAGGFMSALRPCAQIRPGRLPLERTDFAPFRFLRAFDVATGRRRLTSKPPAPALSSIAIDRHGGLQSWRFDSNGKRSPQRALSARQSAPAKEAKSE